jgi:MFS family permease
MALPAFMIAFGQLLVWVLSYFLPWRSTAYLLIIPSILLTLFILLLPETPYWLIEQNNEIDAKKSLKFFRGKDYDITDEINEIQQKHDSKQKGDTNQTWKFIVKRLFSKAFLKPYSCVGILYLINTWSGFSQVQIFMIEILEKSGSRIDPKIAPIVTGFLRLAFAGNLYRGVFSYNAIQKTLYNSASKNCI